MDWAMGKMTASVLTILEISVCCTAAACTDISASTFFSSLLHPRRNGARQAARAIAIQVFLVIVFFIKINLLRQSSKSQCPRLFSGFDLDFVFALHPFFLRVLRASVSPWLVLLLPLIRVHSRLNVYCFL